MTSAESGISCSTVVSSLFPCLGYLRRGGARPSPSCYDAVKFLNNAYAARATPDRQAVCRCIKSLVPTVGAKQDVVNSIPEKCHLDIPYKYSPSLDCSKVN